MQTVHDSYSIISILNKMSDDKQKTLIEILESEEYRDDSQALKTALITFSADKNWQRFIAENE